MSSNHILKNLHSLIRNAAMTYMNEFVWQDVELTSEFKDAYSQYLKNNGCDIEFLGFTAVITSSSAKSIYVPNQWFVIASYSVLVFEELHRYKDYFRKVSDKLGKQPESYARVLRDSPSVKDKDEFLQAANELFSSLSSEKEIVEESSARLWRFVSDYAWWSGQKTIDRGDFYYSVVLNMLNLVNASQGYVAEIVSSYASDSKLRQLTVSPYQFTVNLEHGDDGSTREAMLQDTKITDEKTSSSRDDSGETIPKPERVRIKISGSTSVKEIKYKG